MLNQKQQEMINGSLLGDGTIWTNFVDPLCKFQLTQSKFDKEKFDKKSYMLWWVDEFIEHGCSIRYKSFHGSGIVSSDKIFEKYIFNTKCGKFWTELEKEWYVPIIHDHWKRKKTIPNSLKLTPLTACIWMMEDGSNYSKDGNITLETQGFSINEVEFLIEKLKSDLGILSSKKKTPKKDQYRIYIGVKSQKDFIHLIKPHVKWDCFKYKLDDSYSKIHQTGENHSQSKLTKQQAEEIILSRQQGKTVKEISLLFNISKANISLITSGNRWSHLENKFEVKRKPRITKEQKQQIFELSLTGLSQGTIAKQLNINQATVSRTLKSI